MQTPIPELGNLAVDDPVWRFEAARVESELLARNDPDSASWLVEMAQFQHDRGRLGSSLSFVAQAVEVARRVQSVGDQMHALCIRASVQTIQGNFNSARDTLGVVYTLAERLHSPAMNALAEETFATLLLRRVGSTSFDFFEAGERYTRAAEVYQDLGDVSGQIRTAAGNASISSGKGEYLTALEQVDGALRLAAETGEWKHLGQLLGCAAFAFRDQGYRQNLHELFELAIQWASFVGDIPQQIRIKGGHAELFRMQFSPPDPEGVRKTVALMNEAISEAREIGAGPMMLEMQMALAGAYRKAGDRISQQKQRELAEQMAATEAFEGAHRLIDWNDFIEDQLVLVRGERIASRLEEAIEGSADPFFVFDPRQGTDEAHFDLLNEFRNTAANRMMAMDNSDVRVMADLVLSPQFTGLREPLLRVSRQRESYEDEVSVTSPEGKVVWYARRVAPAGEGAVVTFRDVTSSHEIKEAFRVAAERAHEADRAKSEFLANMSHEVRTPINGVLGLAQLLRDLELGPVAKRYVEGIVSSGNILLKVIGDVLDLSKIEARKMQIDASPVHLQALISEVIELLRGQVGEGVALTAKVSEDLPAMVILDGVSLRQVLTNLIGNAIKFTPAGSIDLAVTQAEDTLLFEVRDTGIGVPEHHLETIFQPFQQAQNDSELGGTGLGLTISRRLVELMGGEMQVSSTSGKGSCFSFTLPLIEAPAQKPEDAAVNVEDSIRFDGKAVLLVEDNPVNTMVSEGMLTHLGCTVTCVENGLEAVKILETRSFDLVLMDVRMPIMDGLAATKAIRQAEKSSGRHTPVVALTAGALTQERDACLASGMDDYLVKPFTARSLRETLFRALG